MPKPGRRTGRGNRATKDRVLQARIPEDLDEQLRDRAEQLGLSVSSIVRNVLLHTFDLVEGVVSDSAQLAQVVQGRRARASTSPAAPETSVVGWQEAVLNQNGVCEQCNAILTRGERAAVGVPVQARPVLLCLTCLAAMASGKHSPAPPARNEEGPASQPNASRHRKRLAR